MTNRYQRMKMQRRMQRRIRLVVEERRMAFGSGPRATEPVTDLEETAEITPLGDPAVEPGVAPARMPTVERVPVRSA